MLQIKKKILLGLLALILSVNCFAQDFTEEFENLINTEKPSLLPEKMIFTQKILWGENGLFRKTGISNLTVENREKELIIREKMLKSKKRSLKVTIFKMNAYIKVYLEVNFIMVIIAFIINTKPLVKL